jgi:hypothetical protein
MGLLVAGITGGASLIDNARITSLKREVDDHIRDIFTFYARVGRLPGDLDNSGKFGHASGRNLYVAGNFSDPYNTIDPIGIAYGPFIELYLYGISSFKPTTNATILGTGLTSANVREKANGGGIPFSKVYKDFMYVHRYETGSGCVGSADLFCYGMSNKTAIETFMTEFQTVGNKKTVDTAKKLDIKFDDGSYNGGNTRGYCGTGGGLGSISYTTATVCSEVMFYFDVK